MILRNKNLARSHIYWILLSSSICLNPDPLLRITMQRSMCIVGSPRDSRLQNPKVIQQPRAVPCCAAQQRNSIESVYRLKFDTVPSIQKGQMFAQLN
jgi:hypothetical protein